MHEVGIIASTLAVVDRQVRAHHATRVHRLALRVGALAGVDLDALRFAFDAGSPGTVAEGAELVIEPVAAEAYCLTCDKLFPAGDGVICRCPDCEQLSGDIRHGRELELRRLELS